MEVHCTIRPTGNPLADAYMSGAAAAQRLYAYDVHDPQFASLRAQDLDQSYDEMQRPKLVAALRSYAMELGAETYAEPLLQKLATPGCLVVVTGQQAGIFTGPAYTLYKAVSTVALARQLEAKLGRPVVPVFWLAAEDHDFDEAASAWYVTRGGQLSRAVVKDRPPLRTPVGRHQISARDIEQMFAQLAAELPDGMYREDVLREARAAYDRTNNMADGFAALLAHWLQDCPLLFVNPLRRDVRELMQPAFARVLERPELFVQAAKAGAAAVRASGYTPQVDVHDHHSLIFLVDDDRRSAIDLTDDSLMFTLRDRQEVVARSDIYHRLQKHPEDFSAGVLYRPVTQDELFPVLAYVGGAAEVAYHGMMGPVFAAAGRKVPPLFLRSRVLQVPRSVKRALASYQIEIADVQRAGLLEEWLVRDVQPSLDQVLGDLERAVTELVSDNSAYFVSIDDTMHKAVAKTKLALARDVQRLRSKAYTALRRRHAQVVATHSELTAWLWPEGHEQERLLSPLSLLAKYGTGWLLELSQRDLKMEEMTTIHW